MATDAERKMLRFLFAGGIVAIATAFFIQTRDPMILVFGGIATIVAFVVMGTRGGRHGVVAVNVKCSGCASLNLQGARFCSQCGQAL